MRSKALRRANRERMVVKAKRIWPHGNPGKYADNLAKCSCVMCGNPRRYDLKDPLTVQEKRMMCEPLEVAS